MLYLLVCYEILTFIPITSNMKITNQIVFG